MGRTSYRNLSGDAGIVDYELLEDSLILTFKGGERYLYTEKSVGQANLDAMRHLAVSGRGLTTFVNQHIRSRYAKKL
jgi:hypothetical protein